MTGTPYMFGPRHVNGSSGLESADSSPLGTQGGGRAWLRGGPAAMQTVESDGN